MKKFIVSVLAVSLAAGAFAQELSKEEQKAIKDAQKEITANLKAAEKASKLSEDAMGQVDVTKVPDFAAARAEVAKAFANKYANTMLGDINRTAGNVEFNSYKIYLPGAGQGDQAALNNLFQNCGNGFEYYMAAWEAYATPDAKGKANTKFNDAISQNAWALYSVSNGLANCGFTAYNEQKWEEAAKYFELAAKGADSDMIKAAADPKKNPAAVLELEKYAADSVKYQNLLYAGSCYSNIDKQKSLAVFKSLVGKNTPQLAVYSSIIGEYAQLTDTTEMITWLQKGMEALPTENYFPNNLFMIYLDRNDIDGAINAMKASLANNSSNAGIATIIGRLYAQKNEFEPAKEYFQKALALDPSNLDANLYYGYTFLAEMELGESEMLKNHASNAEMDRFSAGKIQAALPLLRTAFKQDTNHENNDIPNLLMQVLYRQFAPTNAPNRQALIDEYNEVARAYGRPEKN